MDIRKLQRVIVDGLEDVKAQNIVVFNTEHLSPLFERVIVASGTSNRQTKSLAASVRDAVKAAGDPAPRTEGEDNGEWIIVDCGAAVVHVMQPAIREYYHLEELWGDKPVQDEDRARAADAPGEGGGARRTTATRRRAAHGGRARPAAPTGSAVTKQAAAPADARSARSGAASSRRAERARRRRPSVSSIGVTVGVKSSGRQGGPKPAARPAAKKASAEALSAPAPHRDSRRRTVKLVLVAVGQRPPAWAQTPPSTTTPSAFRPSCASS